MHCDPDWNCSCGQRNIPGRKRKNDPRPICPVCFLVKPRENDRKSKRTNDTYSNESESMRELKKYRATVRNEYGMNQHSKGPEATQIKSGSVTVSISKQIFKVSEIRLNSSLFSQRDRKRGENSKEITEFGFNAIIELLDIPEAKIRKVVDVGCGEENLLLRFKHAGFEIFEIEICGETFEKIDPQVKSSCILADATKETSWLAEIMTADVVIFSNYAIAEQVSYLIEHNIAVVAEIGCIIVTTRRESFCKIENVSIGFTTRKFE